MWRNWAIGVTALAGLAALHWGMSVLGPWQIPGLGALKGSAPETWFARDSTTLAAGHPPDTTAGLPPLLPTTESPPDSALASQLGLDTVSVDTLDHNRLVNPLGAEGTPVLDAFFAALHAEQTAGRPPRIGFYGDSQIEGDRITQVIRYRLHRSLGGKGLGYIPFEEPATHHSLTRTTRGSWYHYTCHQNRYASNSVSYTHLTLPTKA
jgi:hypothetical protein